MINKEVIEPIINFQKIRYVKLSELLDDKGFKIRRRFNVFINMETILDYFYKEDIIAAMNSLKSRENIILVPEFLNLIAHYRHYFATRYQAKSRFFIYHINKGVTRAKHNYMSKILNKYSKDNIHTGMMNEIFRSNINMISNICKYIPKVYFIQSDGLEPSIIPYYIIDKYSKEKDYNIIISRDYYDYQLTNFNNSFMLTAAGNRSKIYNNHDAINKKVRNSHEEYGLTAWHIPFIIALIGDKDRNIERVDKITPKKACKLIGSISKNNRYEHSSLQYEINKLIDTKDLFNYNLRITSLDYQNKNINKIDEELICKDLVDMYDINALIELNSVYFTNNNIHLEELFEGV